MFKKRKNKIEDGPIEKIIVSEAIAAEPQQDLALIAVIAAAIAASLETSVNGIVIRSIRRSAASTPKWAAAGREQQIYQQL